MSFIIGEYYECTCGCKQIVIVTDFDDETVFTTEITTDNTIHYDRTAQKDLYLEHLPNYEKTLKTEQEVEELIK